MRQNLSIKELLLMGGAVFSMHFGASCMLFPVTWGKDAGTALFLVYLGILISGIVLPYFGYKTLVKGKGNFLEISRRIAPKFGTFFVALNILLLGPFYAVPRMSAAAWSATMNLTGWSFEGKLPIMLFSIIFFAVTFWFVSNRGKVVKRIGDFLFPTLIIIVIAVIAKSIISPISTEWTEPSFNQNPIVYGFLRGYAVADLQCALIFGLIVIEGIRNANISESAISKNLLKISIIGLSMLALTHLGHMIAGANLGGTIDLTLAQLYTQMVLLLWGRTGGIFFNFALIAASLTTAIGLISPAAEILDEIMDNKFGYKKLCLISCIISALITTAGLDSIIAVIGPILDAIYPASIVLALFYCFNAKFMSRRSLVSAKYTMIVTLAVCFLSMIHVYVGAYNLDLAWFENIYNSLWLSEYSLTWIPFAVATYVITYFIAGNNDNSLQNEESNLEAS
ncbi:branched-chain amino acid transport system II carrier protein [Wukongibacter baidiensis]|uniref:branched-chain amino acid transport system II carrier protein n=1 Tax=Wukongibacter baidiensis TaxID=1723361 RepID=UPI003D7F5E0A